jgi:prepilin-type N-terminal cleavage/methylation domain-containing protein
MKKIIKNQSGFTMIELLTSIFIIAFVATTFTVSYQRANSRTKITMAAYKMASDIRMAQNYALGLKEKGGYNSWGIAASLNGTEYHLFSDVNGDDAFNDDNTEKEQTFKLPGGIKISSIDMDCVLYEPPDPITYIWQGVIDKNEATIELIDPKGATKKIVINRFGLVDVED